MEKPIIFNAEMINAILDGRKTMTRRIIKPQPKSGIVFGDDLMKRCPYKVGMRLWVRETFAYIADYDGQIIFEDRKALYRATDDDWLVNRWRPSIFMPRKLSRINLEVTDIRVEKLQDISEDDAWAEGINEKEANKRPYINKYGVGCATAVFSNLWESINEKRGY